jgi:hypothetical protein
VPEVPPTTPPTTEQVAEFLRLVGAWIWADRMYREAQDPNADPLPPHVKRLLAPYKVEGAGGESPEQWAERAVAACSEERGAAHAVVAAGRPLALAMEAHGIDSRPVLLVVFAADGGGGCAAMATTWPAARIEIERIGLRLRLAAGARGTDPAEPPHPDPSARPPSPPPDEGLRFVIDLDPDGLRHLVANGKRLSYANAGRGGQLTKRHAGAGFLVALATGGRLPHIRADALEDLRRALERGTNQGLTITGSADTYAFSAPVTVTERLLRHFEARVRRRRTPPAR